VVQVGGGRQGLLAAPDRGGGGRKAGGDGVGHPPLLATSTIAAIYEDRWQIEMFF
jgi:hypothetical protein